MTVHVPSAITTSLSRLFRKKRGERFPRNLSVLLFDAGGASGPAVLVDASDEGAKLHCADRALLEDASVFLILERAEAYEVKRVWRIADNAGFRILRSRSVRGFVEPVFDPARNAWEAITRAEARPVSAPFGGRAPR